VVVIVTPKNLETLETILMEFKTILLSDILFRQLQYQPVKARMRKIKNVVEVVEEEEKKGIVRLGSIVIKMIVVAKE